MQLNNPNPNTVTRQEPFQFKAALVVSLNEKIVKREPEVHNKQLVAPISALNLGFTKINVSELKLLATKTITTEIKQTLASQKLEMDKLDGNLASITSLVGRLPAFDYHNLNGICYLRIKK